MPRDVFISYSKDAGPANQACEHLERAGVTCWMAPRDIPGGVDYGGAIVDALRTSRVLVLLFSKASNASPQVLREVKIAAELNLPIVAVRVETVTPSSSMTYYLGGYQWIDAFDLTTDVYLARLTRDVGAIVQRGTVATKAEPDQGEPEAWDAEWFMSYAGDLFRRGVPLGQYPEFDLPPGWYYGPRSGPERSVSGHANVEHRRALYLFQTALGLPEQGVEADGLYGPGTRSAVKAFQAEHGLATDGLIGPETWRAVWLAAAYPFEVG